MMNRGGGGSGASRVVVRAVTGGWLSSRCRGGRCCCWGAPRWTTSAKGDADATVRASCACVCAGDNLEKVYFHIPNVCMYINDDLKAQILQEIDRSSPIAKVWPACSGGSLVPGATELHAPPPPPLSTTPSLQSNTPFEYTSA